MLDEAFWDAYTERQEVRDTKPALSRILSPVWDEIHSVLEVGCNRGDNLIWMPPAMDVEGVEPNAAARQQARDRGLDVEYGTADDLPYPDDWADLVFTAGVLIHIPPDRLDRSLREIYRVAAKYILAIEYYAETPTPIKYRGIPGGIWKRNYFQEYVSATALSVDNVVGSGVESDLEGTPFEGSSWWLFRK